MYRFGAYVYALFILYANQLPMFAKLIIAYKKLYLEGIDVIE